MGMVQGTYVRDGHGSRYCCSRWAWFKVLMLEMGMVQGTVVNWMKHTCWHYCFFVFMIMQRYWILRVHLKIQTPPQINSLKWKLGSSWFMKVFKPKARCWKSLQRASHSCTFVPLQPQAGLHRGQEADKCTLLQAWPVPNGVRWWGKRRGRRQSRRWRHEKRTHQPAAWHRHWHGGDQTLLVRDMPVHGPLAATASTVTVLLLLTFFGIPITGLCLEDILWTTQPFVTHLGMVVYNCQP